MTTGDLCTSRSIWLPFPLEDFYFKALTPNLRFTVTRFIFESQHLLKLMTVIFLNVI